MPTRTTTLFEQCYVVGSRKLMDSKHETFTIKITDIVNLILGRDDV